MPLAASLYSNDVRGDQPVDLHHRKRLSKELGSRQEKTLTEPTWRLYLRILVPFVIDSIFEGHSWAITLNSPVPVEIKEILCAAQDLARLIATIR